MERLHLVPVSWEIAQGFCRAWHRTHPDPPPGHKWQHGVATSAGLLVGVAIVGRPIARHFDDGLTVEVVRTVTDGHQNANSILYAAVARAAFALGYQRVVTYTEHSEKGGSLRAAGWHVVAERPARTGWDCVARPREPGRDLMPRTLWETTSAL
jgi:hypothetical protein